MLANKTWICPAGYEIDFVPCTKSIIRVEIYLVGLLRILPAGFSSQSNPRIIPDNTVSFENAIDIDILMRIRKHGVEVCRINRDVVVP